MLHNPLFAVTKPPGSAPSVEANIVEDKHWYYIVMWCYAAQKDFYLSVHLHGERDICNSVDNFFERPSRHETTNFTVRIWFIRSDNIWEV